MRNLCSLSFSTVLILIGLFEQWDAYKYIPKILFAPITMFMMNKDDVIYHQKLTACTP